MKDDLDKTACQFNHTTAKYVIHQLMLIGLSKQIIEYIEKNDTDIQSTITAQEDVIKRLKDDAERLATTDSWRTGDSDSNGEWCKFCYAEIIGDKDGDVYECNHEPTCPITLHSQLMNELGEK